MDFANKKKMFIGLLFIAGIIVHGSGSLFPCLEFIRVKENQSRKIQNTKGKKEKIKRLLVWDEKSGITNLIFIYSANL